MRRRSGRDTVNFWGGAGSPSASLPRQSEGGSARAVQQPMAPLAGTHRQFERRQGRRKYGSPIRPDVGSTGARLRPYALARQSIPPGAWEGRYLLRLATT